MFRKPRDLFQYIGLSFFGFAIMLVLIHLLGEVHGLIVTAIILFGQTASTSVRISALQRELTFLRQRQGETGATVTNQV